jgi:FkbM family methyltransferase
MQSAELLSPIRLRGSFFSAKRIIARGMCHPYVGRLISMVFRDRIPSRGHVIYTSHPAVIPSVKASLFWGIYESAEVRFVRDYLRKDLDVIELGCSLGVVTCQILEKLEPSRRVVCVEANAYLLETLQKNVEKNFEGRRVTIVQGAISDPQEKGTSINFALRDDNTLSQIALDSNSKDSVQVPALTLSQLLSDNRVEGDFVLVSDIEGAEVNFIENDQDSLLKCQQIIIELHETHWNGHGVTVNQLRQRLEQVHGYQLRANYGPVCVFERTTAPLRAK